MHEFLQLPHAAILLGRNEMITDSTITRRSFISGGAALALTASSVVSAPRAAERRLRMALVGTGARGSFTWGQEVVEGYGDEDRKSTRLNSSHGYLSYAVFCLKKKHVSLIRR